MSQYLHRVNYGYPRVKRNDSAITVAGIRVGKPARNVSQLVESIAFAYLRRIQETKWRIANLRAGEAEAGSKRIDSTLECPDHPSLRDVRHKKTVKTKIGLKCRVRIADECAEFRKKPFGCWVLYCQDHCRKLFRKVEGVTWDSDRAGLSSGCKQARRLNQVVNKLHVLSRVLSTETGIASFAKCFDPESTTNLARSHLSVNPSVPEPVFIIECRFRRNMLGRELVLFHANMAQAWIGWALRVPQIHQAVVGYLTHGVANFEVKDA